MLHNVIFSNSFSTWHYPDIIKPSNNLAKFESNLDLTSDFTNLSMVLITLSNKTVKSYK